MRVLALEPYYGGSHQAFLDGWASRSEHDWTIVSLPAYKWKWRMRHSAITMAHQVRQLESDVRKWDVIFCSAMLPLAEFLGLSPASIRDLPSVIYFHENQLTYPNQPDHQDAERDHHYAFTNFVSAAAADAVWFNSDFHRTEFFSAFETFLNRMPDYQPIGQLQSLRKRSFVQYPGIGANLERGPRKLGPLRVLWNARWEHDKNPELFFRALRELRKTHEFRLLVAGESFKNVPSVFSDAKSEFSQQIDHWGYAKDRLTYEELLQSADVVVSTANHEFFGIGILEAAAAGNVPIVPTRLSYPEVLNQNDKSNAIFFFDGTLPSLVQRLSHYSHLVESAGATGADPLFVISQQASSIAQNFAWSTRAAELDLGLTWAKSKATFGK